MSDWQPIETAPKDGTRILLYDKWTYGCEIGWYVPENQYWNTQGYFTAWHNEEIHAKHWQPLPQPPENQA